MNIENINAITEKRRILENAIISEKIHLFKKSLSFYKWHFEDINLKMDFESEAYYRLFRSVRLHTAEWQNGQKDYLLFYIVKGSFCYTCKRNYATRNLIRSIAEYELFGRKI